VYRSIATLLRATSNFWHRSWAWSQMVHNISWSKPLTRRYSPWESTCSAVSLALLQTMQLQSVFTVVKSTYLFNSLYYYTAINLSSKEATHPLTLDLLYVNIINSKSAITFNHLLYETYVIHECYCNMSIAAMLNCYSITHSADTLHLLPSQSHTELRKKNCAVSGI